MRGKLLDWADQLESRVKGMSLSLDDCPFIMPISIFFLFLAFLLGESKGRMVMDEQYLIRLGERILKEGNFFGETFSWLCMENAQEWVNHEPLSSILFYLADKVFHDGGPVLLGGISGAAAASICVKKRKWRSWGLSGILLFAFLLLSLLLCTHPRAYVLTFPLFAVMVCCLRDSYEDMDLLLFLPPISMLWAWLNGGSAHMAWIFPLIFAFFTLFSDILSRIPMVEVRVPKTSAAHYAGTAVICAAVQFLVPYSSRSFFYAFHQSWRGCPYIAEFQRNGILIFIIGNLSFTALAAWNVFIRKKKVDPACACIYLGCTVAGLAVTRFQPYAGMSAALILTDGLMDISGKGKVRNAPMLRHVIAVVPVLLVIAAFMNGYTLSMQRPAEELLPALEEASPKRIYTDIHCGNWLDGNGEFFCFTDGRGDCYTREQLEDAFLCSLGPGDSKDLSKECGRGVGDVVEKYQFDAMLVQKGTALDEWVNGKGNDSYWMEKETESYSLWLKNEVDF